MDSAKTTRPHHVHDQSHKPSPLSGDAAIQSSSVNSNHKARAARFDAHSQHKALSRSVIAESLDFFLARGEPSLVRTMSDSSKLSQSLSQVGVVVTKPKPGLNPEKERWRKKFYGGEIVKLIYDMGNEKTRRKAEEVKEQLPRRQEEEEEGDVGGLKKRLANLEIVEVDKIKRATNEAVDVKRVPAGGRRRSFCGTETSLSSFLSFNGARIVAVDMPPFMQIHAIDCARKAYDSLEKFTPRSMALSLKKEFDGVYGPAWHCIVGTSFGSFVTHSVGGFLYFSLDQKIYILLFKTTVQRAD